MQIICRCAQSVLDKTAYSIHISFSKNVDGDAVMWISDTAIVDPHDLKLVEWSEARRVLPNPQQIDTMLADLPHTIVSYNQDTKTWRC